MKIKINDRVYVQKYDIAFIARFIKRVPAAIMMDLFEEADAFIMTGREDSISFSTFFQGESANWLMQQSWIINFDDFRKKKASEIKRQCSHEIIMRREYEQFFERQNQEYKIKHYEEAKEELDKRTHRLQSLDLMRLYLKGKIKLAIPC